MHPKKICYKKYILPLNNNCTPEYKKTVRFVSIIIAPNYKLSLGTLNKENRTTHILYIYFEFCAIILKKYIQERV